MTVWVVMVWPRGEQMPVVDVYDDVEAAEALAYDWLEEEHGLDREDVFEDADEKEGMVRYLDDDGGLLGALVMRQA